MRVRIFASGSGGNCLLLSAGDAHLLVDAGLSMRRTGEALRKSMLSWDKLCGVLLTHEHSDHVAGLKNILKDHPLPLYGSAGTLGQLRRKLLINEELLHPLRPEERFSLGPLSILPLPGSHDAAESFGYRVDHEGGSFGLATDTGFVTEALRRGLLGCDTVLLEANHDRELLLCGPYPPSLKFRILSEQGHLSNEQAAAFAAELVASGTRRLVLGHLSQENNTPALAMQTVAKAVPPGAAELYIAPVLGCLSLPVERGGE